MLRLLDSPFIRLLREQMREDWRLLLGLTLLAGGSDTLLLVLINESTADAMAGELSLPRLVMFMSMLSIHVLTSYQMLRMAGVAMQQLVYGFRTRIFERLMRVELPEYEKLGKAELQLSLGRDIGILSAPSTPVFSVLGTIITTICSFFYLAYLSPLTALVVAAMNVGFGIYFLNSRLRVNGVIQEGSDLEAHLFNKASHLFLGFKELKMHRARRLELLESQLLPLSEQVRERQDLSNRRLAQHFTSSNVFYYVAIGITLFVLPSLRVLVGEAAANTIVVMIFLFGNVNEILFTLSMLLQYDVAVANLERLEATLERPPLDENAPDNRRLQAETQFECLELRAARFSYYDTQGGSVFTVGPIDLEIRRGELLFLVGGNGSGKSTLLRMLTGLYLPERGTLALNGVPISPSNVDTYRQYFSTVFTDFHLFDLFYGLPDVTEAEVQTLLKRFQLDEKTFYDAHRLSTQDLSTGQRKRLALLTALLEKRPILILDEVSADQDPAFRRFYYEEFLPELMAAGRTIVVVSHDDRFFKVADRVIYLDDGRIDPSRAQAKA